MVERPHKKKIEMSHRDEECAKLEMETSRAWPRARMCSERSEKVDARPEVTQGSRSTQKECRETVPKL